MIHRGPETAERRMVNGAAVQETVESGSQDPTSIQYRYGLRRLSSLTRPEGPIGRYRPLQFRKKETEPAWMLSGGGSLIAMATWDRAEMGGVHYPKIDYQDLYYTRRRSRRRRSARSTRSIRRFSRPREARIPLREVEVLARRGAPTMAKKAWANAASGTMPWMISFSVDHVPEGAKAVRVIFMPISEAIASTRSW